MRDLEDGPEGFVPLFAFMTGGFGVAEFGGVFEEGRLDGGEAGGWWLFLGAVAEGWHCGGEKDLVERAEGAR